MKQESYESGEQALDAALEHASHILPAQGPIGNFVHHNTLHAYQHLPFHEAVRTAGAMHDAEAYLGEAQYRRALAEGRMQDIDIERALELRARALGRQASALVGGRERLSLEHLILRFGLPHERGVPSALRADLPRVVVEALRERTRSWLAAHDPVRDRDLDRLLSPHTSMALLRTLADADLDGAAAQAGWAMCRKLAPLDPLPHAGLLGRVGRDRTPRDVLRALDARDPNELTNPVLIEFLGAYLDEGMARWAMPNRECGMLASFIDAHAVDRRSLPAFHRRALARLERARALPPRSLAVALLDELGVRADDYAPYLSRTLLELPGFTGMVSRLEHMPSDRAEGAPPVSLLELTILRLALDLEAYEECARAIGYTGRIADFGAFAARRLSSGHVDNEESARGLFELCQLAGIAAPQLLEFGAPFAEEACAVIDELSLELRPLLHEAYEHAHLREVLDAIAKHREASVPERAAAPKFQIMFCIDDREESIRRYIEELDPGHLTYGVAGFFGVAMRFRGIDDASAVSLCPVVVEPGHAIEEIPLEEAAHEEALAQRRRLQSRAAQLRWEVGDASRSLARGAALMPLVGLFSAVPLTLRVLFPHATERLKRWLSGRAVPTPRTQLRLERGDHTTHETGLASGFTIAEQAERVAGTLENIGLVDRFAPLVTVLGHGASTVNNPHHSAYDCGACGGRNGGPNARAFAAMANSPQVRAALCARGIDVPDGTWFIGGLHDTTTDEVRLFDLELVPATLKGELASLRTALDHARMLSAHERCRKFEHAPQNPSPSIALRHVEERAVDLSQARPELGHATNAVCIVGRRELSRDLFLDRRSFLVSYSADIDPDLKILERVLGAVVPVGAGINLEYYFSTVDNEVWGSGTKLPHNLSGLLGVMEGASGDLRTGLPRQMIEVHDPVRLLSLIEATPEAILEVAARKPEVAELVTKEWVRVASVHPQTGAIQVFDGGVFRPYVPGEKTLPTVGSAEEWYRGNLGFLSPVRIVKGRHQAA